MGAIISKEENFCFIHIPKTGGTTVSSIINKNLGNFDATIPREENRPIPYGLCKTHIGHPSYVYLKSILNEEFDHLFKFSVVRNPWDRAFSLYKHFLYANSSLYKDFTFEKFIMQEISEKWPSKLKGRIRRAFDQTSKAQFKISQSHYLINSDEDLANINLIIRFEKLYETISLISEDSAHPLHKLFIKTTTTNGKEIHQKNSRERFKKRKIKRINKIKSYKDAYTAVLKKEVEKICERDIDLFKYTY